MIGATTPGSFGRFPLLLALGLILALVLIYLKVFRGGEPMFSDNVDLESRKREMVRVLVDYGIRDEGVLKAMEKVPRHKFIPQGQAGLYEAYGDHPCSIGYGQTISQPYIVAYMTERLSPRKGEKVLEIGTGSGYQAAILAELGAEVFSIEIVPELAEHARKVLKAEGFPGVSVLTGDGYKGWPENAPFDVIIVTCAPEEIPQALKDQLKEGGRMILPIGPSGDQRLVIVRKTKGKTAVEDDLPVRFVPMVHSR